MKSFRITNSYEYPILFLGILFPWNQIGLQFHLYHGDGIVEHSLVYFSVFFVLILVALSLSSKIHRRLLLFIEGYISLSLLFSILVVLGAEGQWHRFVGVIVYGFAMIWIVHNKRVLRKFIVVNFVFGIILINLNSLTLLHWYEIVDLPYVQVERVGGKTDGSEAHLDPFSFGIFGLTENHIHPNNLLSSARLQGWSSEPLHWAYFVYWTLTCSFLLMFDAKQKNRNFLKVFVLSILFHLLYLQSTASNIIFIITFSLIIMIKLSRGIVINNKYYCHILFILLTLLPGIIIPFLLVTISNMSELFLSGNFLGESPKNWETKINFLDFGLSLWLRIFPSPGIYELPSHNLILEKYIEGGYLFVFPLLVFFYSFLKYVVIRGSILFTIVVILTVLVNTLGVPTAFFTPFGIMWLTSIYAFVYYYKNYADSIRNKCLFHAYPVSAQANKR